MTGSSIRGVADRRKKQDLVYRAAVRLGGSKPFIFTCGNPFFHACERSRFIRVEKMGSHM